MKKIVSILALTACISILSSCDDDGWKENSGTPELALSHAVGTRACAYLLDEKYAYIYDKDLIVRDKLLELGPYLSTDTKESTADRYFIYQTNWTGSNTGPDYLKLTFYEDGLVKLHHKSSFGHHHYLYFSIDSDKAKEINDYIFNYYTVNLDNI